jgi:hypothetical protein
MANIKRKIKNRVIDFLDSYTVKKMRNNEKKKYKDKRRVDIYSKIKLAENQKQQIDALYVNNYGKKIPYVWHQNFMAHSGKFDAAYFPESLYTSEFERYMNLWPEYANVFSDKNVTSILASGAGVKMPKEILSAVKGLNRDSKYSLISRNRAIDLLGNAGRVFIKPTVNSCSGEGCFIADFKDGIDQISQKTADSIYSSLGEDFVIQNVIKCHSSISCIYEDSVNTFRVITYRWKDEILHMPVTMRIGQGGSYLDNAHAGGMFVALDDDGIMHKNAMTEFNIQYAKHPDSNFVFENYKIELLPKVIEAAKKIHVAMPQIGVVNWDFTIDEFGDPLLIEANSSGGGGIWLPQMAHGCGVFGEKNEEILQWMRKMKLTPRTKRYKYAFGK